MSFFDVVKNEMRKEKATNDTKYYFKALHSAVTDKDDCELGYQEKVEA